MEASTEPSTAAAPAATAPATQTGTGKLIRWLAGSLLVAGGKFGPDSSHVLVKLGEDRDAAFGDPV